MIKFKLEILADCKLNKTYTVIVAYSYFQALNLKLFFYVPVSLKVWSILISLIHFLYMRQKRAAEDF